LHVRLLGTAAGGGFPQWNCNCRGCQTARTDAARAIPRTQSCVTVSADGEHWFLLNAPPDIRIQMESFLPLLPPKGTIRGTGVEAVLVTNADLDHTLGLFILREGQPLTVHTSPAVSQALTDGLRLPLVLDHYCKLEWKDPPTALKSLLKRDGKPSGLLMSSFPVPGKWPRYMLPKASPERSALGFRLVDEMTGKKLVFIPDLAAPDATVLKEMANCDLLLVDGTFWGEGEMVEQGVGTLTASQMAHWIVGGPEGSLQKIKGLPAAKKVYVHINNTNPMLLEDSLERSEVVKAGVEVGRDGMEYSL
jgi:pyrroloquinoline quinone biosynthesis protein B